MASMSWLVFVLVLLLYVGLAALSLWIMYLIIRTAVKNGILAAWRERANPTRRS